LWQINTFSAPSSDPAAYQGRIRTQPHVEGQWAAYVYVPVSLSGCSPGLHKLLHRLLNVACDEVPELYPLLKIGGKCTPAERHKEELHISLSRPIFLRAHQREGLRKSVKEIACYSKRLVPPTPQGFSFSAGSKDSRLRSPI